MKTKFIISCIIYIFPLPEFIRAQSILERIDSINSIPYVDIVSNLIKHKYLFEDNLQLARNINYNEGIARARSKLALIEYLLGKYDVSINHHIEAIKIFGSLKIYEDLSDEYGELGYQQKNKIFKKHFIIWASEFGLLKNMRSF